ncbi:MAG: sulfatase, partial [Pedobacter sp.]
FLITPNLDKMAKSGVILTQNYCAAPVCAPSRASILLGQSQGHANVRNNQFDKALSNNYTLGNVFQSIGYKTAAIGKWGLQGKDLSGHPIKRGFDYYYGYIGHGDGHEHYPKEGIYRGKKRVWENETDVSEALDKCYTGDLWTAKAKQWIATHGANQDQPFFMYLAYDTPHAVFELPTSSYPSGSGLNGGLKFTGIPGRMINTAEGIPDSWIHPDYINATYDHDANPDTKEQPWPETYKRFATSVRRLDDEIGDLIDLLKDMNIDTNTMIVFSSDNGPTIESYLPAPNVRYQANFFSSFGPFDGIKRDLLEGGMRMPVIVKWKGQIPCGKVVSTPSISYDWMPTLLDAAGSAPPVVSDGVSLMPSLIGKGFQAKSNIYSEYEEGGKTPSYPEFAPANRGRVRNQMQMIRMGNIVGVRYDIKSHEDDFQLFNVMRDLQQKEDLSNTMPMANLQKEFKDKIIRMRRVDVEVPRPYDSVAIPSIKVNKVRKGLKWSIYRSDEKWIPNTNKLKPVSKGISLNLKSSLSSLQSVDIITFEGYLRIPIDGEYT